MDEEMLTEHDDDQLRIIEDLNDCVICQEKSEKDLTKTLAGNLATQLKRFDDDNLLFIELRNRLLR